MMETEKVTKSDQVKIVIVEDDSFYGEILRKYISQIAESIFPQKSASVCHHLSAEECLNNLDPETHLFVLDYNLAGGGATNGLELLKMVQSECPTARSVIVTQTSDFATINQFNMLGADRYILKDERTPINMMTALKQLLVQGS